MKRLAAGPCCSSNVFVLLLNLTTHVPELIPVSARAQTPGNPGAWTRRGAKVNETTSIAVRLPRCSPPASFGRSYTDKAPPRRKWWRVQTLGRSSVAQVKAAERPLRLTECPRRIASRLIVHDLAATAHSHRVSWTARQGEAKCCRYLSPACTLPAASCAAGRDSGARSRARRGEETQLAPNRCDAKAR